MTAAALHCSSSLAADNDYPPTPSVAAVRAAIDRRTRPHPRLLVSADTFAELSRHAPAAGARLAAHIIREAEAMLALPPIERKVTGRRLLGESRRCVKRVLTLALAARLDGRPEFTARCEREMLTAAGFKDWNPSHFLDVGEMTFALAVGYDWLHDQLSDDTRARIRAAILEKGLRTSRQTRYSRWVRANNNWGQVCHAGMVAGALAVMDDDPDLAAEMVQRAVVNVPRAMAAYDPRGSYPEGPGYWSYGTHYNVILIDLLEHGLGTDFGLAKAPGFDQTATYINVVTGPSGQFFNYADGGAGRGPLPALYWFAERYDRPDWIAGEPNHLNEALERWQPKDAAAGGHRLLPLALLWMNDLPPAGEIHMPLHWSSGGHVPITVHRTSWTNPRAAYVGLKGGSPSWNHGQMDTGSFVLEADGVRWGIDLGAEGYHGIESRGMNLWSRKQNSDRWTIFRQMNHGHNTLVIDDQLQQADGFAPVVTFSDATDFPCSVLDLSDVYKGQAQAVHRGVRLLPGGEVLIHDVLRGLKPGSNVRWGMITRAGTEATEADVMQLHQDNATMSLTRLAPSAAPWTIVDTATPRNEWDSPNRGTCMAAFTATAPASGNLDLVVLFTPGSCTQSQRHNLPLESPLTWTK